jgi:Mg-chelatase subunit ChlI
VAFDVEGHRGDAVIVRAARAIAALEERSSVRPADLGRAAELALAHRTKTSANGDAHGLDPAKLERLVKDADARRPRSCGLPDPAEDEPHGR